MFTVITFDLSNNKNNMKNLTELAHEIALLDLAKQICKYNGQAGTQKQIDKCIKSFCNSLELMQQFQKNRFPNFIKIIK